MIPTNNAALVNFPFSSVAPRSNPPIDLLVDAYLLHWGRRGNIPAGALSPSEVGKPGRGVLCDMLLGIGCLPLSEEGDEAPVLRVLTFGADILKGRFLGGETEWVFIGERESGKVIFGWLKDGN